MHQSKGAALCRFRSLAALSRLKLNLLTVLKGLKAIHQNVRMMNEQVLTAIVRHDKPIAFLIAEPLHCPNSHYYTSIFTRPQAGQTVLPPVHTAVCAPGMRTPYKCRGVSCTYFARTSQHQTFCLFPYCTIDHGSVRYQLTKKYFFVVFYLGVCMSGSGPDPARLSIYVRHKYEIVFSVFFHHSWKISFRD